METNTGTPTREIPINLYKPNAPLACKVLSNTRLTGTDVAADVRHLVFDLSGGDMRYLEGQSVGILPPGTDEAGKPLKLRLYSIASTRDGDQGDGKTVSLCVKRVVYTDPETGREVRGPASNYLCDLEPGMEAQLTGPVGRTFLLPEDPSANIIMIATGTGIAPFRAFVRRLFSEGRAHRGMVRLYFGMHTSSEILYREELAAIAAAHPNFVQVNAISSEQKSATGRHMWVQDRVREQADLIWPLLNDAKTTVYICGLKGMEAGVEESMAAIASRHGADWEMMRDEYKRAKRWHVETY